MKKIVEKIRQGKQMIISFVMVRTFLLSFVSNGKNKQYNVIDTIFSVFQKLL